MFNNITMCSVFVTYINYIHEYNSITYISIALIIYYI